MQHFKSGYIVDNRRRQSGWLEWHSHSLEWPLLCYWRWQEFWSRPWIYFFLLDLIWLAMFRTSVVTSWSALANCADFAARRSCLISTMVTYSLVAIRASDPAGPIQSAPPVTNTYLTVRPVIASANGLILPALGICSTPNLRSNRFAATSMLGIGMGAPWLCLGTFWNPCVLAELKKGHASHGSTIF